MKTRPDPRVEDLVRAGRVRVALFHLGAEIASAGGDVIWGSSELG